MNNILTTIEGWYLKIYHPYLDESTKVNYRNKIDKVTELINKLNQ